MKVFISWSGVLSRRVAEELRDWIPSVLHTVEPFVSSKDIYAGARWQQEVSQQLEETSFGIICVTKENIRAPWLNFEAGALAKVMDSSRVMPLAVDLKPAEIPNPLAQFQGQSMDRSGIRNLMMSLNDVCDTGLSEQRFQRSFDKWWEDLDEALEGIVASGVSSASSTVTTTTDRDMLEQILETVRGLSRQSGTGTSTSSSSKADSPSQVMARELIEGHFPDVRVLSHRDGSRVGIRPQTSDELTGEEIIAIETFARNAGVEAQFLKPSARARARRLGEVATAADPAEDSGDVQEG